MSYYCETPGGEAAHVNAGSPAEAAESFVGDMACAGMVPSGDEVYVRVTDNRRIAAKVSHYQVAVEMVPSASAMPCDGDGLGFDSPTPTGEGAR